MTLDGWSLRTSTCRIDAVSSDGAETSARSRVASESISVVVRSACSISSRIERRSTPSSSGRPSTAVDELLGVDAVAALRRHPACRGVRMRQQPERLELGELAAHRRRRDAKPGALDEHARADRLAGRDVLLDDAPQDLALTWRELHPGPMVAAERGCRPGSRQASSSAVTPPPRKRPRRVSRSSSPRPFALSSTRPSSTRRVERVAIECVARRRRARRGSSSRRPSSSRSRTWVAWSIGSTSRGGSSPRRERARRSAPGSAGSAGARPTTVDTAPIPSPR